MYTPFNEEMISHPVKLLSILKKLMSYFFLHFFLKHEMIYEY